MDEKKKEERLTNAKMVNETIERNSDHCAALARVAAQYVPDEARKFTVSALMRTAFELGRSCGKVEASFVSLQSIDLALGKPLAPVTMDPPTVGQFFNDEDKS